MARKRKIEVVEGVPNWAVCGLVNDDWSGTPDEDVKMVMDWKRGLNEEGWLLIAPIDGTENEFNSCPAFGLPCDTVDFSMMREEDVK